MLFRIAAFELRQQLRSHVFWIVFAISVLMVVGALSVEQLRVGIGAERGAALVVRTHLLWSLFYMFTAAAFVADAVLRDDLTGFAPILQSTPARRRDVVLGRFIGALAATIICFLSVPMALLATNLLPWTDPALAAPPSAAAYLLGSLGLAIPNLVISSAAFFGLATATRSMFGTLIGAAALLALYGGGRGGEASGTVLFEPFGFAAYAAATTGWTGTELEAGVPALAGSLLLNRIIWLCAAVVLVAVAVFRYRPREPRPANAAVVSESATPRVAQPLPDPSYDWGARRAAYVARTRLELRQLVFTPAFLVLLLLGLGQAGATLWPIAAKGGESADLIRALIDAFQLVPLVVAIFFAGELMWNEQDRRVAALIAASPVSAGALLLPKLLALGLVLLGLALITGLGAAATELAHGRAPDLLAYFLAYVGPKSLDWLLVGVAALFLQAVSPNKLAGWGLMVLYLIASLALQQTGYTAPLYRYGAYPGTPFPARITGASDTGLYRLYWSAFALLLLALVLAVWGRGETESFPSRLRLARTKLHGWIGVLALGAAISFAAIGFLLA